MEPASLYELALLNKHLLKLIFPFNYDISIHPALD
jgi:hypothetical protein